MMNKFLYRVFLFCIPVVLLTIGCEIYLRNIPSQYKQKRDQLVANADSIEILVLGSSHAMDAVNPQQFSFYTHNLAFGSQAVYFDRKLAEKYVPDLPRLKYVLLTLDYNGLYYDHEKSRDFFYHYYHGIDYKNRKFPKESLSQFWFVYTPGETLSLMSNRQTVKLVKGYKNEMDSDAETVMSPEKCRLRADVFNETISQWHDGDEVLDDLNALIVFLQSRNITPVLITFPNYSGLRSLMSPAIIERTREIGQTLSLKYKIPYLDYFEDESFVVSDYFNSDHLNKEGAIKLSQKINTVIEELELKK